MAETRKDLISENAQITRTTVEILNDRDVLECVMNGFFACADEKEKSKLNLIHVHAEINNRLLGDLKGSDDTLLLLNLSKRVDKRGDDPRFNPKFFPFTLQKGEFEDLSKERKSKYLPLKDAVESDMIKDKYSLMLNLLSSFADFHEEQKVKMFFMDVVRAKLGLMVNVLKMRKFGFDRVGVVVESNAIKGYSQRVFSGYFSLPTMNPMFMRFKKDTFEYSDIVRVSMDDLMENYSKVGDESDWFDRKFIDECLDSYWVGGRDYAVGIDRII